MSWLKRRAAEAARVACTEASKAPDCECDYHDCPCEPCVRVQIEAVAQEFATRLVYAMDRSADDNPYRRAIAAADKDDQI